MSTREHLGEFEQIVLLAVLRLDENAYGVPVRREIEKRTKRSLTVGALYRTLDRLEAKGYVASWFGDPVAERGGRSKRYFRVEPLGARALRQSQKDLAAMWEGVELSKVIRGSLNFRHHFPACPPPSPGFRRCAVRRIVRGSPFRDPPP